MFNSYFSSVWFEYLLTTDHYMLEEGGAIKKISEPVAETGTVRSASFLQTSLSFPHFLLHGEDGREKFSALNDLST